MKLTERTLKRNLFTREFDHLIGRCKTHTNECIFSGAEDSRIPATTRQLQQQPKSQQLIERWQRVQGTVSTCLC